MTDSFEFTLHSPLTEDDLAALCDYEHEHSNSVTFQTPKGKQVKYIKADILDKIREEIESLSNANPSNWHTCDVVEREGVLEIIDKYRQDGNERGSCRGA